MSENMQEKLTKALTSNCEAWGCVDPHIAAAEMARKALETIMEGWLIPSPVPVERLNLLTDGERVGK